MDTIVILIANDWERVDLEEIIMRDKEDKNHEHDIIPEASTNDVLLSLDKYKGDTIFVIDRDFPDPAYPLKTLYKGIDIARNIRKRVPKAEIFLTVDDTKEISESEREQLGLRLVLKTDLKSTIVTEINKVIAKRPPSQNPGGTHDTTYG